MKAMFHATALVRDYDLAVERLGQVIGLRVLEYSELPDPLIGRRGGMTWIGDGSLEVGQPIVDGAPPDRFVARTGGGMQGCALWVEDFSATIAHLEAHDVSVPVQMPDGFGFSSPRATCGLQLEWSAFTVAEDPRTGASVPPLEGTPALDVTHLAFIGAVVADPQADARRLATLFGTEVTFERPDAALGEPEAGVSVGDCTLALYRLDRDRSADLWGRRHDRPQVSLLGVCVSDLAAAHVALADADVGVVRETGSAVVLEPATTGDVEIAVVDQLLPGDPRA
jgi:hypothetical protein